MCALESFSKHQAEMNQAAKRRFKWLEEERQKYWSKQDPSTPGIKEFYTGRNILVTGGTGFIGKVLVEHLLRLIPGVGKIFLLIRVKRDQVPSERLKTILNTELFKMLRKQQPDAINKVVAISADMSAEGIGISPEDRITLQNEVSAVFHAAASVRFDDPLKQAVLLNTRGTHELIELCKGMRNLKTFVHVSTLYCNTDQKLTLEQVYPTPYDWKTMIKLAETHSKDDLDALSLKILGFQPNTYTFTKQLSEKIVDDAGREIPVIIVRPGVVTAMRGDPLDGFMDNLNGPSGFMAGVLPGVLRVARLNKNVHLNYTSVDASVKIIVAAGWLRGTNQKLNGDPQKTNVVNTSAEDIYAVTYEQLRAMVPIFCEKVTPKCIQAPRFSMTTNAWTYKYKVFISHLLMGIIVDLALKVMGIKPRIILQEPNVQALKIGGKMSSEQICFISSARGNDLLLLKIYRKVHIVNEALNHFLMRNYPSKTDNFWLCISRTKEQEFQPDINVNLINELIVQWDYFCKHILPQEPGNPTVFKMLELFERFKGAFKALVYLWIVWKVLLIFVHRYV